MIKYLVSDLDGTLLKSDETIASSDIEAILKWTNSGKHFVVASGRPVSFMRKLNELGVYPEFMLGSTGSVLSDGKKEEVLGAINDYYALKMVEFLDDYDETDYIIDGYSFRGFYAKDKFGYFKRHMRTADIGIVSEPKSFFGDNEPILKFFVICKDDEVAYKLAKDIESGFDGYFKAYHADRGCLEVVMKRTGKWPGILALAEHLNVDPESFACIGDEENDKEMIKNCGYGFAMQGANEDIRQVSKKVVKSVKEAIDSLLEGENV